jgi:hypothetical protein
MNIYTKKHLLPTLALVCLAPLASQNAQAAATFSSYATVTYTIDSLTSTNAGDFSGLGIAGSFELASGQETQQIIGDGSVTPTAANSGFTDLIPAVGSSYTRTFQLDGNVGNTGLVNANYLGLLGLAFNNASTTDSYSIGITLSYELHGNVSGDNAFSDISLSYSNEDNTFAGADWIGTALPELDTAYLQNSQTYNFTLAPEGYESLYVDAGITGSLEVTSVPVPSALWLFGSALLAIPGIKKAKRTV